MQIAYSEPSMYCGGIIAAWSPLICKYFKRNLIAANLGI